MQWLTRIADMWRDLPPEQQLLLVGTVVVVAAVAVVVWLQERAPGAAFGAGAEGPAAIRTVGVGELHDSLPRLGPKLIPYVPREGINHSALAKHLRLALVGPTGCGTTREAAEIALRVCANLPRRVALLLFDGAGGALPEEALRGAEHAVLLADDLHLNWHPAEPAGDDAPTLIVPSPVDWLAEAIAWLTERIPGRVHVIVTAAAEPWEQMRRDSRAGELLRGFHEAWVPRMTDGESAAYLRAICEAFDIEAPEDSVAAEFSRANDGTFRPIYDFVAGLRSARPKARSLTTEDAAEFAGFVLRRWLEAALERLPREARDVVEALRALRACGVPLARQFIVPVCARLSGRTATASYRRDRESALDELAMAHLVVQPGGRNLCHPARLRLPERGPAAHEIAQVAIALAEVAERQPGCPFLAPAFAALTLRFGALGAHRQALALSRYWLTTQPGNPQALSALGVAHVRASGTVVHDLFGEPGTTKGQPRNSGQTPKSDPGPVRWEPTGRQGGMAPRQREPGLRISVSVPEFRKHVRQAIECFEAAARVWTRERRPWAWAMLRNNLGVAHLVLGRGDAPEHQDRALACFEEALSGWTPEAFPHHHAVAGRNLEVARKAVAEAQHAPGPELRPAASE